MGDGVADVPLPPRPTLSAVVVHWRDEEHLQQLVASWRPDESCELLVVDNSRTLQLLPPFVTVLDPGANLGFGGGANHGIAAARGAWILLLNPDARPREGAIAALLSAVQDLPEEVGGLVPALQGDTGEGQQGWQLQPLPSAWNLVAQTLFLAGVRGPKSPPPAGTSIEQPAAAALLLRRSLLQSLGGFDDGFYPAWFEDVDLGRRIRQSGAILRYAPQARFVHAMGGSVPQLGYGPFLWVYYRNLCRYLAKHHGVGWQRLARCTLVLGMGLRLALLPLRRPRRATSRGQAAKALVDVMVGAVSAWRRPAVHVSSFRRPETESP